MSRPSAVEAFPKKVGDDNALMKVVITLMMIVMRAMLQKRITMVIPPMHPMKTTIKTTNQSHQKTMMNLMMKNISRMQKEMLLTMKKQMMHQNKMMTKKNFHQKEIMTKNNWHQKEMIMKKKKTNGFACHY
jgi:hypothetical protein